MSWDEIRQMQESGMRFGAHSISHAILTKMDSATAGREIHDSVAGIQRRLGTAVEEFAYPNGDSNPAIAEYARQAGTRLAFTMNPRHSSPNDDAFQLGRYNICEATSRSLFHEFSQAYFWCEVSGVFAFLLRRERRGRGNA